MLSDHWGYRIRENNRTNKSERKKDPDEAYNRDWTKKDYERTKNASVLQPIPQALTISILVRIDWGLRLWDGLGRTLFRFGGRICHHAGRPNGRVLLSNSPHSFINMAIVRLTDECNVRTIEFVTCVWKNKV
jgi:hypothetical protein